MAGFAQPILSTTSGMRFVNATAARGPIPWETISISSETAQVAHQHLAFEGAAQRFVRIGRSAARVKKQLWIGRRVKRHPDIALAGKNADEFTAMTSGAAHRTPGVLHNEGRYTYG